MAGFDWSLLIPGYGIGKGLYNTFNGQPGKGSLGDALFGLYPNSSANGQYQPTAEQQWLADREDSQVQRLVADFEKAGLNPWLAFQNSIGGVNYSPNSSSDADKSIKNLSAILMALAAVARFMA